MTKTALFPVNYPLPWSKDILLSSTAFRNTVPEVEQIHDAQILLKRPIKMTYV